MQNNHKKAAGHNTHRSVIKYTVVLLIPDIHFFNQVIGTTHFVYQE